MTVPTVTHRVVRVAHRTRTVEIMRPGGVLDPVTIDYHETTCACGRVFSTGSELMTAARYLGHLPRPSHETTVTS